jgi:hypothetical protein
MEASVLCFLEPGYDKWYESYVDCRMPAKLEQSLLRTYIFKLFAKTITLLLFLGFIKFYDQILFSF